MKIYDLEQDIMECWKVVDDIELTTKWFIDAPEWEGMDPKLCDAMMNKYFAIKELYDLKFNQMWATFEAVCKEHHQLRRKE